MQQGNQTVHSRFGQTLLLILLLLLFYLLSSQLMFMLSAFLGSVTLYTLFRWPQQYLIRKRKYSRPVSAILLMGVSLVILLIPLYLTGVFLVHRIEPLIADPAPIVSALHTMNAFINRYIEFSLLSPGSIDRISGLAQKLLPYIIDSGINIITNLVMMYFILWFMMNNGPEMERWIKVNSPFRRSHTAEIIRCIRIGIISNATGIVLLGIIQGMVATLGYLIFGLNEPLLWGMITGAASVIPFVGTMLAWVPLSLLMMAGGQLYQGIGLFLYGLFIVGSSDNVFRFILQKKMASTHPLITVLGVIAGMSLLGFWGLIFGPLMISLLIIFIRIYRETYPPNKKPGKTPAS